MNISLNAFAMATTPEPMGSGGARQPPPLSSDSAGGPSPSGFDALMEAKTPPAEGLRSVPQPAPAGGPLAAVHGLSPDAQAARSLGDIILGGLQTVSSDMQRTWDAAGAAVGASPEQLTPQTLLKLQIEMSSMTMQYELVNKAVTRSTQNIDQLVKLQ